MLTQKQENFVNDIFNGMPQRDAYINRYSTKNMLSTTIDRAACQLAQNSKIATRLEEMRQEVKGSLIAGEIERREILSEIARGDLLDYQEVGADGGYLSIDKKSPNTKAVSEITSRTEYNNDGANAALITKIKLHNPVPAIDLLNKMDGSYPPTAIDLDFGKPFRELLDRLQGHRVIEDKTRLLGDTSKGG